MGNSEDLNKITGLLSSPLFWDAATAVLITGVIVVGAKNVIVAVVNYLKVLLDKNYGRGSRVVWGGEQGYIRDIGFRYITIDTDDNIYRVPLSKWSSTTIQIPKQHWNRENNN